MSSRSTPTFEDLLRLAEAVSLPADDEKREVQWCGDGNIVGLSRQRSGAFELFLCGAQLAASSPLVRHHLVFDQWSRAGGEVFEANRIVFPAEDNYISVAAFLAEELLRRDIRTSLERGFAQTEPLMKMALRRISLTEEELLGLLGELRFLEVLLTAAGEGRRAMVLDSWRGHERTSRDFVLWAPRCRG